MLYFFVTVRSFLINSFLFAQILQGCFAGTGAVVELSQFQWSNPEGCGVNLLKPVWLIKDHSLYGPSQWQTTSQCNVVFHWLNPYPEWSLIFLGIYCGYRHNSISPITREQDCFSFLGSTFPNSNQKIANFIELFDSLTLVPVPYINGIWTKSSLCLQMSYLLVLSHQLAQCWRLQSRYIFIRVSLAIDGLCNHILSRWQWLAKSSVTSNNNSSPPPSAVYMRQWIGWALV